MHVDAVLAVEGRRRLCARIEQGASVASVAEAMGVSHRYRLQVVAALA